MEANASGVSKGEASAGEVAKDNFEEDRAEWEPRKWASDWLPPMPPPSLLRSTMKEEDSSKIPPFASPPNGGGLLPLPPTRWKSSPLSSSSRVLRER